MKKLMTITTICMPFLFFSCKNGGGGGTNTQNNTPQVPTPTPVLTSPLAPHTDMLPGSNNFDGGELILQNLPIAACRFQNNLNFQTEYHVQSFGNTSLTFSFPAGPSSLSPTNIKIQGPFKDSRGTPNNIGIEPTIPFSPVNITSVTLPARGIYRVIVTCNSPTTTTATMLTVACTTNCGRPAMSLQDFFNKVGKTIGVNVLQPMIEQQLKKVVTDPALQSLYLAQFQQIYNSAITNVSAAIDKIRFPLLTRKIITDLRIAEQKYAQIYGMSIPYNNSEKPPALNDTSIPPSPKFTDNFIKCDLKKPEPKQTPSSGTAIDIMPLTALATQPYVLYGQFTNLAMSECQRFSSDKMSEILNLLAKNSLPSTKDKFTISYNKNTNIQTPTALINELMNTGHRIMLRNVKTSANFLSFMVVTPNLNDDFTNKLPNSADLDVRWVPWIDTGIPLTATSTLQIPMGHSQLDIDIIGNDVIGRVAFYLGIGGVGFWPDTDSRPEWTGLRSLAATISSDDGAEQIEKIKSTTDAMLVYYTRIKNEVGTGEWADGYGMRGVCDDSVAATIALSSGKTDQTTIQSLISEYPLIRMKSGLNIPTTVAASDQFNVIFPLMQHDIDDTINPTDMLRRIGYMTTHSLSTLNLVDGSLYTSNSNDINYNNDPTLAGRPIPISSTNTSQLNLDLNSIIANPNYTAINFASYLP